MPWLGTKLAQTTGYSEADINKAEIVNIQAKIEKKEEIVDKTATRLSTVEAIGKFLATSFYMTGADTRFNPGGAGETFPGMK